MFLVIIMTFISYSCLAATFYVDPINGSMTNNGSYNAPWSTIQDVVDGGKIETITPVSIPFVIGEPTQVKNAGAPVQPGDTILCFGGYQGYLFITGYYNTDFIHVGEVAGEVAEFSGIEIRGSSHWSFDNLTISKEFDNSYGGTLFFLNSHGYHGYVHHVELKNSTLYTKWDAYSWSATDWVNNAAHGVHNAQTVSDITIANNYIKNIRTGIAMYGNSSTIENNLIENFSLDGMRGNGSNLKFYYNTVKNCYDVDDNHDDLFQSFNLGTGIFSGGELIGNVLIGSDDPNQPVALRGDPQGIGMFDGFFENWIISNNVVAVNHWHGITLFGVRNTVVSNNTLTKQDLSHPNSPWIRMVAHKDGRPSENNTMVNNIYHNIVSNQDGPFSNNIKLNTAALYDEHFVDWQNNDFRLKPTSSLIDAGTSLGAPAIDVDGTPRPQGGGFDIGAYEHSTTAPCATFTPQVDAQKEQDWANYTNKPITNNLTGTIANSADLSGFYKIHWDANNLYLWVEVTDDVVLNDNSPSFVHDDGVSVYLDGGNEKAAGYDANDHNFTFRWNDTNIRHGNMLNPAGVVKEEQLIQGGYAMEISIAWSLIGVPPAEGNTIGLDIHLNDDDDGGDRDKKLSWYGLVDQAWASASVFGEYTLPAPCGNRLVTCDIKLFLEGPYSATTGLMSTSLKSSNLLPAGQPYNSAPWFYNGTEGNGWTDANYPAGSVDWVLVSLRTTPQPESEIAQAAAVLLEDGSISALQFPLDATVGPVYVVVEHHNHLPAMTPTAINIMNDVLSYDFRVADSYTSGIGFGQKNMGITWALYGGNGDNSDSNGYDINAVDKIYWQSINGTFSQYISGDFNLDGDVNGADKVLWNENNGTFSEITR